MKKKSFMRVLLIIALIMGMSSFVDAKGSHGSKHGSKSKKTEFYYHSYGGFIKDDGNASHNLRAYATYFTEGQDDQTEDGVWFREGPFTCAVQFGDQNNGNKADMNDYLNAHAQPGTVIAYPALAWGHPEEDPWTSVGGPGDDIGGASGVGLIGYGYNDTGNKHNKGRRKIVVGDDTVLYPVGGIQHHNYPIGFSGDMSVWISWNMEIYNKKGKQLFKGHNYFNMHQWETINASLDEQGNVISDPNGCPRKLIDFDTGMSAKEFNTMQHNKYPWWPDYNSDFVFYSDGHTEPVACSDAFGYDAKIRQVSFKDGKKEYVVTIDGFWHYHPEINGCPALVDPFNVPEGDLRTAWALKCFKKHPTFWSEERQENTGWIRMVIKEKGAEEGCTCRDIKPIDSITMKWDGADGTVVTLMDGSTKTVNKGDIVTESGLEGKGNDITWTLSGATTGTSTFHISCSDDDMNDAGDIGKYEGNGKKDDSSLVNQWIFVDMGGQGGTLTDCSTQPSGASCKDQKPIDKLALRWQGTETITKINVWFSEVGKGGNPPAQVITDPVDPNELLIVSGLSNDNPKDIVLELFDESGSKIGESLFHISCSEEDMNDPSDCGNMVGAGKTDDPSWIKQWRFEGMSGASGDPVAFCPAP